MSRHIVIDARIRRSSTGRYVDRLVEHLQLVDSTNTYSILIQPDDPWKPTGKNFIRVHCSYPQFSLNPLHQIGLAWQLYQLKADLVHFPLNSQPVLYLGKTMVSTLDLTLFQYARRGTTPKTTFWFKMALFRFLFWFSNRKAVQIITISNYVQDELAKKYPFTKGKTSTTYNASEPPLAVAAEKPTKINKPFILYIGSAFPHKNLEKLIKAFDILKNTSQPELFLVLAGKKDYYYEQLEHLAQYSTNRDSIIFTGFVPDQQLKWLYQHAEAYVFPSLSEGFGLPGLEAMVHNCPVVSSNTTCLPEVYGDAAVYFDPNDAQDMADKITSVMQDGSLRAKLIARGHLQAKKYSWRTMAEQTLEVYKKALGE